MGGGKGGSSGKDDSNASAKNGWSEADMRAWLGTLASAVDYLAESLDTVGLTQRLRESPACNLRSLDRSLPNYPLEDLLLACEAFATVTSPAALATSDFTKIGDEAQRLLQFFHVLSRTGRGRGLLSSLGNTLTGSQNVLLRSAIGDRRVQEDLAEIMDALASLAEIEGGESAAHRQALPISKGCIIPVAVLGGAITLVALLLGSFAFATGQPPITPGGLNIPGFSQNLHPGATATANAQNGKRTPVVATATSGSGGSATATPKAAPTATTPAPSSPKILLSTSTVSACFDSPGSFTITYTGGQQPITWNASWPDHTNVAVSPASGTLRAGGSTTVTVNILSDTTLSGTITISPSNGLSSRTVQYDGSNC